MDLFDLTARLMVDDSQFTSKIQTAVKVGAAAATALTGALATVATASVKAFAEFEQLSGGAAKIFDELDQTKILKDANDAYMTLGMSANEYLAKINDVGAAFSATMGDAKGYETAKAGLQAISDYASGTGKDVGMLSEKFTMITRSTSSYQSIADQFSGILPATSAAFLEQAQAAGFLSNKYKTLTEVPIEEYQSAVTDMLGKGVDALGLTGNTAAEAATTISGSMAAVKSAWANLLTGFADENANVEQLTQQLLESATNVFNNIAPVVSRILPSLVSAMSTIVAELSSILPQMISDTLPALVDGATAIVGGLVSGIQQSLPVLLPAVQQVLLAFSNFMMQNLPTLVSVAMQTILAFGQFLAEQAPTMIPMIVELIMSIVSMMIENIDLLVDASIAIINGIAAGLLTALPMLIEKAPEIVSSFASAIVANFPMLLDTGIAAVLSMITGIYEALPDIAASAYEIIGTLLSSMGEMVKDLYGAGIQVANSILDGIKAGWANLKQWVSDAWNGIKNIFKIGSGDVQISGNVSSSSRASGLDYVPYNGYAATLHRGEAVLTSTEANAWRNGAGSAGNTINIYPQTLDNATVDYLYARFNARMGAMA